ncbi:MAG: hypothetical protein JW982_01515 [Spirochaetes bacterium]|nr:hypothetical protein [Spirochaetota bacterium]
MDLFVTCVGGGVIAFVIAGSIKWIFSKNKSSLPVKDKSLISVIYGSEKDKKFEAEKIESFFKKLKQKDLFFRLNVDIKRARKKLVISASFGLNELKDISLPPAYIVHFIFDQNIKTRFSELVYGSYHADHGLDGVQAVLYAPVEFTKDMEKNLYELVDFVYFMRLYVKRRLLIISKLQQFLTRNEIKNIFNFYNGSESLNRHHKKILNKMFRTADHSTELLAAQIIQNGEKTLSDTGFFEDMEPCDYQKEIISSFIKSKSESDMNVIMEVYSKTDDYQLKKMILEYFGILKSDDQIEFLFEILIDSIRSKDHLQDDIAETLIACSSTGTLKYFQEIIHIINDSALKNEIRETVRKIRFRLLGDEKGGLSLKEVNDLNGALSDDDSPKKGSLSMRNDR